MLKWMFLVVLIISGSILGYLYTRLDSIEVATSTSPRVYPSNAILVIHSFKDGVHRFSGEIRLPHSCYAVTTTVDHDPQEEHALIISLATVDHILDQRICAQFTTRYPFQVITESPEATPFTLRVDGVKQPIRVTTVDWENPNATLIIPQ